MKTVILAGAALAALCLSTAPAMAQDTGTQDAGSTWPITGYGSLGYTLRTDGAHLGALTGRLGLRYGRFVGAEMEGSFGVEDHGYTLSTGQPYNLYTDGLKIYTGDLLHLSTMGRSSCAGRPRGCVEMTEVIINIEKSIINS